MSDPSSLPADALRVLIVSGLYPTAENPADGIFVHEQVQALRRAGVDARVVAIKPFWVSLRRLGRSLHRFRREHADAVGTWRERDGVPVMYLSHIATVLVPPALYPLRRARILRKALSRIGADFPYELVHGHTAYWDGAAALVAARAGRVPLIVTEHTGPLASVLDTPLKRVLVRRTMQAAARVVAVSRALRDEIGRRGLRDPMTIDVVPNGVDTAFFDPALCKAEALRPPRRLVWIGGFVAVKRIDRLLDAFALAAKSVPDLALTLVGDGPLKTDMQARAAQLGLSDRIAFLPAAGRAGVRAALAETDALVISSDVETFGVVGIEALAMGRPVVATRCGGPEDYVRTPAQGRIVPATVEGLAAGMVDIAAAPPAPAAEIRASARGTYDFTIVAADLKRLYREVLAGSA